MTIQERLQQIVDDIAERFPNPFEGNVKRNIEAINFYMARTYDECAVRADIDQRNRKITLYLD